jgi:hypothetical protein
MANQPKRPQPPPPPRPAAPDYDPYDGKELSDADLEYVVGGVDPAYWQAQTDYLKDLWGIKG